MVLAEVLGIFKRYIFKIELRFDNDLLQSLRKFSSFSPKFSVVNNFAVYNKSFDFFRVHNFNFIPMLWVLLV